jgi:two-component system, NarL family, nitrate/nitrite response regulator NarL
LIRTVLSNAQWERIAPEGAPPLSEKEKCILRYIADGAPNTLIARKLKVAEATVKVHVKAILRKIPCSKPHTGCHLGN